MIAIACYIDCVREMRERGEGKYGAREKMRRRWREVRVGTDRNGHATTKERFGCKDVLGMVGGRVEPEEGRARKQ